MNTSGEAAESIIRMSLQGVEVVAKISGSGAKNVAAMLYAVMKDNQQVRGKTNLVNMMKSGKELKVFSIEKDFLKEFTKEAKRYGVMFSAVVDKGEHSNDGMSDIIVKAEDASKINRIVERYKYATKDVARIVSDVERRESELDKGVVEKSLEEKLVDDILAKPINKEENEMVNPSLAKTEKSPLSEPILDNKKELYQGTKSQKPSVREEIKAIKAEQKAKEDLASKKDKYKNTNKNKHKDKNSKSKNKKVKERGAK